MSFPFHHLCIFLFFSHILPVRKPVHGVFFSILFLDHFILTPPSTAIYSTVPHFTSFLLPHHHCCVTFSCKNNCYLFWFQKKKRNLSMPQLLLPFTPPPPPPPTAADAVSLCLPSQCCLWVLRFIL